MDEKGEVVILCCLMNISGHRIHYESKSFSMNKHFSGKTIYISLPKYELDLSDGAPSLPPTSVEVSLWEAYLPLAF